LQVPAMGWMHTGGRKGIHSEHLGHMLAAMQSVHRAFPGVTW
jgi:ring-1,2-phenylacetyl-CoA epoxidase subunit PaaC